MTPVFFLCKYRDNFKNLLVKIYLVDWKKFITYGHWVTIYQDCSHQLKNMTDRNIIKWSNSLDPDQYFVGPNLGPNCLQMLSVEKILARVKRSCQKFLGYLKKQSAYMILGAPLPWLFKLCKSIKNTPWVICMYIHLFVYESVTALVIVQNWIQSWFIWQI